MGGIVGLEEPARSLRPLQELVLDRRAALEDADQMLEALLARAARLGGADRIRHVSGEHDPALAAVLGDCEVGIARDVGLNLDEVDAAAGEHVHGAATVFRRDDGNRRRELGLRPVEHRARDHHPRAEEGPPRLIAPRRQDRVEVAAHVAHARDAVGEKERQRDLSPAGHPVPEERMDVHVPEARNQVLPGPIDHARAPGNGRAVFGADRGDPVVFDHDGHVGLRRAALRVDHRHVRNGDRRTRAVERWRARDERAKEQEAQCDADLPHR